MINHKILVVPAMALLLTGCTDNMESMSREFRNANNEAIDAMMMVTSEDQAYRMTVRVLKPLNERYSGIEDKMKSWQANRTNKEIVEETFNSNGFYLYLAEVEVNRMRYAMERTRLRNLYRQYQQRKLEEMRAAGDNDPVVANPREVCPYLYDLIATDNLLKKIENQLTDPKIVMLLKQFPTMKGVENYPELHELFLKKRAIIKSDVPRLVW